MGFITKWRKLENTPTERYESQLLALAVLWLYLTSNVYLSVS
jgi:hypothetical protein